MSKRPVRSSGYGAKSSAGGRPGTGGGGGGGARDQRPASDKAGATGAAAAAAAAPEHERGHKMERNADFEMPAISVLMQKKRDAGAEWQEKRKKKMIRRNVPAGEDSDKLKDIIKSLKDQEINVHEFVGLVAPSSGDQGQGLRTILAEEMSMFRRMCRRVYDTMTQDVSDVLANEQIQLTENCNNRIAMFSDKMMRSIDEIFAYIPDFNFEEYYEDAEYLKKHFPLCVADVLNVDEEEALMRQEAFHRYQWLRSEGDRLATENTRLQDRLNHLKQQQKDEMHRAQEAQIHNEETREQLEATEEALQDKVEELNKSIEQTMVENEIATMKTLKHIPTKQRGESKDPKRKKLETRPEWNVGAAQEVEERHTEEATQSQVTMAIPTPLSPSTGAVRKQLKQPKGYKKRSKFQRPPPVPQDADAFHYSPPKTPPGYEMPQQQTSPFHFSPNRRSPSGAQGGSPPMGAGRLSSPRTVRMETSTTVRQPTRMPKAPHYSHHHSTNLW